MDDGLIGASDIAAALAATPCDVAARISRLVGLLEAAGCDALVVTNLRNIRYLTGFSGSAAQLVVHANGATLCTDGRYESQAPVELRDVGVTAVRIEITSEDGGVAPSAKQAFFDAIRAASKEPRSAGGVLRVGLEATSISWSEQRRIAGWISELGVDGVLVATDGVIETLRLVKDPGEVVRVELAASIADLAFAQVRGRLLDGPTESEFGLELDLAMRRLGAAERSFETIVASGPNSALPHARPGMRRIERGDLVVIDFGAMLDSYRSDMTRTVMVGEPSAVQQRLLDVVTAAQAAGARAIGPGVACREVDAACREVIASAGWAERFVHGTGHGVGLDIHEAPWVNSRSAATLAPGQVVTVEPGVYLPGVGGVRVEDTLLVTESGARPLTRAPKDPILV